ncbi:MAG TPA: MBOAT family O-acyltransferase [Candidatus Goldiibacteriota bacterium]|nr:MBOAT family O-acyltransferase [Candidatus Goldiibacteriota bacterium]HPN64824.1 MBOAT family O-acyltransferase [Candidatus Goldiibacteriota bacterium]HRQ43712.1 MBOAT family O-acyltransferase [Candidatus Goldiibacteriota bacterium]
MVFNSLEFFILLFVVFSLYWFLKHKHQNFLLLVASYFFYGWWDWRFLSLLALTSVIDYFCAIWIENSGDEKKRKLILYLSVISNLGVLGFFKYFNFFGDSLASALGMFNINVNSFTLDVILPVGISFYTFQSLSYTIDVYRRTLKPARSFWDFALFVSFFPQLVAGPIERAAHLIPQVLSERKFSIDNIYEGGFLLFWGLFKKIYIADNLAIIADKAFANYQIMDGFGILLGVYAFAFQIYCDFSGYSDMARGIGKLLGFDIMINFNLPYFSKNPSDFWKKWHISLSTWLRDYLYIPLGGNRKGRFMTYRNLFLTMLLGGLWHGAAWNYVLWGFYHGALLAAHKALKPVLERIIKDAGPVLSKTFGLFSIVFMFHLTCAGWLLFRGDSVAQITAMSGKILFEFGAVNPREIANVLCFAAPLIMVQIFQYFSGRLNAVYEAHYSYKAAFYYICLMLILLFGSFGGKEFIYFKF